MQHRATASVVTTTRLVNMLAALRVDSRAPELVARRAVAARGRASPVSPSPRTKPMSCSLSARVEYEPRSSFWKWMKTRSPECRTLLGSCRENNLEGLKANGAIILNELLSEDGAPKRYAAVEVYVDKPSLARSTCAGKAPCSEAHQRRRTCCECGARLCARTPSAPRPLPESPSLELL